MEGNFGKAWGVLIIGLSLILLYEVLHPIVPIFKNFEPSHFWTGYSSPLSDSNQLEIDTNFIIELPDSSTQFEFSDSSMTAEDSLSYVLEDSLVFSKEDSLIMADLEHFTGIKNLDGFFQKLRELKEGKRKRIRIAYFGDSTTEGDLIVGDLRNMLQRFFGGRGVGFVSIAPHGTTFRHTIRHKHSENWTMVNYFRKEKNPAFQFGISGDYSTATQKSMNRSHKVSFEPSRANAPSINSHFDQVFFYYGNGRRDSAVVAPTLYTSIDGSSDTLRFELNGQREVNRIALSQQPCSKVELAFDFPSPFPIYGLSFESETGLIIDNFAKRNDSGSHLGRINGAVLREFYTYMGCDLVILHYGANVLHHHTDYSYYGGILINGIRHLQQNMEGVPVLVLGSTDRVAKLGGKEKTTPAVYGLITSQKSAAARTHNAFLDLFKGMGGEGTMLKWAKEDPPLVAPDYVHFNQRGGRKIATIIHDYLLNGYEAYLSGKPSTYPGMLESYRRAQLKKTILNND